MCSEINAKYSTTHLPVVEESYYEYEVSFYLNFEFGFFFDFFNFANGH